MAKKTASSKSTKNSAPKAKASPKTRKSAKATAAPSAGNEEVTIDRRRPDAGKEESPKVERREKVQRRRQIDPTTCERDYSEQEVEFMNALDQYKRTSGRMFPTCSEVLEVIRGLGYVQLSPAELAARGVDEYSEETAEEPAGQEDDLELAAAGETDF